MFHQNMSACHHPAQKFNYMFTGSVGARISELKQQVIAENPRRYGLAVPRECVFSLCEASTVIRSILQSKFLCSTTPLSVLSVKQPPSL